MSHDWTGIGVILGIVGTAILGIYNGFKKVFSSNRTIWHRTFIGNAKIDELLKEFAKKTDHLDMVSLVVVENGGGIPNPASKIKTSIIAEGFTVNSSSYRNHWQNVPVDTYYMTILRECSLSGYYLANDTSLLEESVVKDAALSKGVTSFKLIYVKACKKSWYYIVLSSTDGAFPIDHKTNDEVRVLVSELNRLINK